jgi:hypothetical protein
MEHRGRSIDLRKYCGVAVLKFIGLIEFLELSGFEGILPR